MDWNRGIVIRNNLVILMCHCQILCRPHEHKDTCFAVMGRQIIDSRSSNLTQLSSSADYDTSIRQARLVSMSGLIQGHG